MMACSMAGTTTRVFAVIHDVDDDAGHNDDDDAIDGDIVKLGSASRTDNDCNTKSGRNPLPIRCCSDGAPSAAVGRGCGGREGGGGNIKQPPAIITPNAEFIPPT